MFVYVCVCCKGMVYMHVCLYMVMYVSLVPRPPPRFYLAAVEKNREKAWCDLSRDVCP